MACIHVLKYPQRLKSWRVRRSCTMIGRRTSNQNFSVCYPGIASPVPRPAINSPSIHAEGKVHHSSLTLDLQDYRAVEFDALQRCAEIIQVDDGGSVQGVDYIPHG
jgi:hypothetical protein